MRIDPVVVIAAVVMSRTIQARRVRPDDAQLAFEVIGAIKEPESLRRFFCARRLALDRGRSQVGHGR